MFNIAGKDEEMSLRKQNILLENLAPGKRSQIYAFLLLMVLRKKSHKVPMNGISDIFRRK